MGDNPCVICKELEDRVKKVDVWVDDLGATISMRGMLELENHKNICNVWKQYPFTPSGNF